MASEFGVFDNHPIPGQSLTRTPNSSPAQQPPQFADPNDALEYLFEKLTEPRMTTRLLILLKHDVPVEFIARAILFQGFTSGKWTPDVALLILKTTMRMIISIARLKKVKVKIFNPDKEQDDFLDEFADKPFPSKEEEKAPDMGTQFSGVLGGNP